MNKELENDQSAGSSTKRKEFLSNIVSKMEELIKEEGKQSDIRITNNLAGMFLDAFVHSVQLSLTQKRKITINALGTFRTSERKSTMGRNPSTGSVIEIPARTVAKFAVATQLKEIVKDGKIK